MAWPSGEGDGWGEQGLQGEGMLGISVSGPPWLGDLQRDSGRCGASDECGFLMVGRLGRGGDQSSGRISQLLKFCV